MHGRRSDLPTRMRKPPAVFSAVSTPTQSSFSAALTQRKPYRPDATARDGAKLSDQRRASALLAAREGEPGEVGEIGEGRSASAASCAALTKHKHDKAKRATLKDSDVR
eukprot:2933842-Pleurochrysis_carterae.AAC.1